MTVSLFVRNCTGWATSASAIQNRRAQDALEHITRLQRAAEAEPAARPSVPEPRSSADGQPHGFAASTPASVSRQNRGWLGAFAAAAGSVLSPQRLLPQLGGALPCPPAAPEALRHSRALIGDELPDVEAAAHGLRYLRSRSRLDHACNGNLQFCGCVLSLPHHRFCIMLLCFE